ncbi:MAG: hypothetical protein PSV23_15920 [Brevundimonas sp.]|uniref:ComEC/Rec2 family competence protein n=1 Tax=Brevundimonas sp. TaxID=1871086 RepID=UPI002487FB57|nr:MBL fold metallo-hydrolase [Brevundimonas sp.]MDI1328281.1 hypothetical protein [Brevundimonas sp.]
MAFDVLAFAAAAVLSAPQVSPASPPPRPAPLFAAPPAFAPALPPPLDVWMLDIGQGSCVYVDCPDRRTALLIDCGSKGARPAVSIPAVVDWVRDRLAVDETVTVIVSHGDEDHYSLLHNLDASRVDRVRLGGLRADYRGPSGKLAQIDGWLQAVEASGGDVAVWAPNAFSAADPELSCGGVSVDVLVASYLQSAPTTAVDSRKNADSAVIRVRHGGVSVVMAGDAEGSTQQAALRNAEAAGLVLSGDTVLMGSHHGARTAGSNNPPWVDAWRPTVGAFSASVAVRFGHPQCEVVARFAATARPIAERYPVSCGVGARQEVRYVSSAIVNTFDNGTVLFRLSGENGLTILCEILTPGCDAALQPFEAP